MSIPEFTKTLENLRIEADTLRDFHQTSADSLLTIGKTLESVFNQLNGAIETAHADQIDSRDQSKLVSECIAKLLGDKPTEDEIADPVPGGNGGVFKAKKPLSGGNIPDGSVDAVNIIDPGIKGSRLSQEPLAKGHGLSSDKGGFAPSDLTGGEHEGYVPDPEMEDKKEQGDG